MKIRLYQKLFSLLALTLLTLGCSNQAPVADKSPDSQQSPVAQETPTTASTATANATVPKLAQSWQLINFGAPW